MLLPGVPPLVREGDRFEARFTVRNASHGRTMDVEVNGNVAGQALAAAAAHACGRRSTRSRMGSDGAGQRRRTALGRDGRRKWAQPAKRQTDRLKVKQKIIPAVPVRTFQATLISSSSRWILQSRFRRMP